MRDTSRMESDASGPLSFSLDGDRLEGARGDTVASALLRAKVTTFTRSIKYHRPRGPFCLAGSCGQCLMRVDGVPSLLACRTPAREGMRCERQNGPLGVENDLFRVGFVNRWERRDPRTGLNYASFLVQWHIYEPPYRLSPQSNQIAPVLLDYPLQKESDQQGLLYSAGVRKGARFSDGTELTAEHVAASLEKTAAFRLNASAMARGDRVLFRLKRPNARFDLLLARFDHGIVLERGREFLGTGPYTLAPDPQPDCFKLVRNPHSRPSARLAEIECRIYPLDANGRRTKLLEAVNRGQVDFTDELAREAEKAGLEY